MEIPSEGIFVGNGKLFIDGSSNKRTILKASDGRDSNFTYTQELMYYTAHGGDNYSPENQASGAYVFRFILLKGSI